MSASFHPRVPLLNCYRQVQRWSWACGGCSAGQSHIYSVDMHWALSSAVGTGDTAREWQTQVPMLVIGKAEG